MPKVSLRRLLSRLTALAITTSAVGVSAEVSYGNEPLPATRAAVDELEDDREIDRDEVDSQDAASALGRGLALALGELRPLEATQLAATWSLSRDPLRRLALGLALEWIFPLVGDALIIEHLAGDRDPEIRAAAARVAWIRQTTQVNGPPTWSDLLARLSDDPDPQVRAIAQSARR